MNRRKFVASVGATIVARPISAIAIPSPAVVAWLSSLHPSHSVTLPSLLKGFAENGYVEGRNLTIKDASAEGHPERFPERAAEVVNEGVSLIAAVSGLPCVAAAKAHTSTIPIVFVIAGDPVELGLVRSFNRPGGNLTGVANTGALIVAKQVEILNELVPGDLPLAMLLDPDAEGAVFEKSAKAAGETLSRAILIVHAPTDQHFESAFASIGGGKVAGVVINNQPLFASHHKQLATLAQRFHIPAIYDPQDLAASDGLASYGPSIYDIFHQVGVIGGKILAGANPAEFPVEAPDRIQLKVNLKTARSLGIEVPVSLLARADEVIE